MLVTRAATMAPPGGISPVERNELADVLAEGAVEAGPGRAGGLANGRQELGARDALGVEESGGVEEEPGGGGPSREIPPSVKSKTRRSQSSLSSTPNKSPALAQRT